MKSKIILEIETSENYCSTSCPYLEADSAVGRLTYCLLFGWVSRKEDGGTVYLRHARCKKAEKQVEAVTKSILSVVTNTKAIISEAKND